MSDGSLETDRDSVGAPASAAGSEDVWCLPLDYQAVRASGFEGTEAEAYSELGAALESRGKADEALVALHRSAELDPKDSLVWYRIGGIHMRRRRYQEAAEAFTASAALLPDHWVTQLNWGKALAGLGRHGEAVEAFTRAAQLNPKAVSALAERARSRAALGLLDEAIADLEAAVSLQPEGRRHRQALEALYRRRRARGPSP